MVKQNLNEYFNKINSAVNRCGLESTVLSRVGNWPFLLIRPKIFNDKRPCLLFAGSFHGDEPAGAWGILHFLETVNPIMFENVNASFLPMVNPTGIEAGTRKNAWGEDPNRNFFADNSLFEGSPSKEGQILINNISTIAPLAADIYISLHEDSEQNKFYIYTYEHSDIPSKFSHILKGVGAKYFGVLEDGTYSAGTVNDGIILNEFSSALDDVLFQSGTKITATTETPMIRPFKERVFVNSEIISTTVNFFVDRQ